MKNNKNKKKTIIIVSLLIVCIIAGAAVIVLYQADHQKKEWTGIPVDTPEGTLFISDEWSEYLDVKVDDTHDYSITFSGKYDKYQIRLFTLTFGESEENTVLGNFKDGTCVSVKMYPLEIPEDIPEEKQDAFYAMQEEINNLTEQLQEMEEFQSEN